MAGKSKYRFMKAILIISLFSMFVCWEIKRWHKRNFPPEINPQKSFLLIDSLILSLILIVWGIIMIFGIERNILYKDWDAFGLIDLVDLLFLLTFVVYFLLTIFFWFKYIMVPKSLSGKDWMKNRIIK